MKPQRTFLIAALFMGLPALAWACEKPGEKPEIPDPNSAVTAQMVKANKEVKAYVTAMEEYLNCARLSSGKHDRAVRELKDFAGQFNEAVRAFKKRASSN